MAIDANVQSTATGRGHPAISVGAPGSQRWNRSSIASSGSRPVYGETLAAGSYAIARRWLVWRSLPS